MKSIKYQIICKYYINTIGTTSPSDCQREGCA